jgi:hypothetical protein
MNPIIGLKSMDKLNACLGWSNVRDFLRNLVKMKQNIEEENIDEENINKKTIKKSIEKKLDDLIPKREQTQLQPLHPVVWKVQALNLCLLLKRRAACILPRNQDGADLLIPFFIGDGKGN